MGREVAGDVVRDGALVEGGGAILRDEPERLRKPWQAVDVAGPGRVPARQVEGARVLAGAEFFGVLAPVVGDAAVDNKTFLGVADGGLEHLVEALRAVVRQQPLPRADGARHGDGVGALEIDGVDAALPEPVHARRSRRRA